MNYKDFFKDKRISVIGLGSYGEMIPDIRFLARIKAKVSVYDIRSEKRLSQFMEELREIELENRVFGKIIEDNILQSDLIILSLDISKKSLFLKKAIEAGIQTEYPDILFFKLVQPITFVGIMGAYGKSSVTHLVYSMLKKAFVDYEDQGLFLIDSGIGSGALTHLKRIKKGDIAVVKIPENLISQYHTIHISPHVAIMTSVIPFDILEFQTHNNFIVASDDVVDSMKAEFEAKAKILRTRSSVVPEEWKMQRNISHDRENASLALQTSTLFKVSRDIAREVIEGFSGLKGNIEMVKKVNGIEFYNDSGSITPQATLKALQFLSLGRNIILIMGGAYTGHDYGELIKNLPQYVSTIILISGSGTIGIREEIEKQLVDRIIHAISLENAVIEAKDCCGPGDIVLFSPAFEAVGVDISRKERGERFVRAVRGL